MNEIEDLINILDGVYPIYAEERADGSGPNDWDGEAIELADAYPILREALRQAEADRDEAREEATGLKEMIAARYSFNTEIRTLTDERDVARADLAEINKMWSELAILLRAEITTAAATRDAACEEAARLRAVGLALLQAAEMSRNWEVLPEDEFDEMYPSEDGWASGDVDENLCCAMEAARAALEGGEK